MCNLSYIIKSIISLLEKCLDWLVTSHSLLLLMIFVLCLRVISVNFSLHFPHPPCVFINIVWFLGQCVTFIHLGVMLLIFFFFSLNTPHGSASLVDMCLFFYP